MAASDSGLSDAEVGKEYAAIRFYIESKVRYVPTKDIQEYDKKQRSFPYDAYVATELVDENGDTLYEAAVVLGVSDDIEDLMNQSTRWRKPNRRRSDVVSDLEKKNRQSKQSLASSKSKPKIKIPKKAKVVPPIPFEEAKEKLADKIPVMTSSLNFNPQASFSSESLITQKDLEIQQLKAKLEEMNKQLSVKISDHEVEPENKRSTEITTEVDPQSPSCNGSNSLNFPSTSFSTPRSSLNSPLPQRYPERKLLAPKQLSVTLRRLDTDSLTTTGVNLANKLSSQATATVPGRGLSGSGHSSPTGTGVSLPRGNFSPVSAIVAPGLSGSGLSRYKRLHSPQEKDKVFKRKKSLSTIRMQTQQAQQKRDLRNNQEVPKASTSRQAAKHTESHRKYVRKIKACQYDSDDYKKSDLKKRERLSTWDKDVIDERTKKKVKKTMFHIHYDVSVPKRNWNKALNAKSGYGFIRELYPHVWEITDFVERAVQLDRTRNSDNRVPVTPRKFEALKRGYVQWALQKNIIKTEVKTLQEKKDRAKKINKFGRMFGQVIAQERAKWSKTSEEIRELKSQAIYVDEEMDYSDTEERSDEEVTDETNLHNSEDNEPGSHENSIDEEE